MFLAIIENEEKRRSCYKKRNMLFFKLNTMNYQMLKTLIDSLVTNFRCPNCEGQVWESNIEIVWAAGTSVNLDIGCAQCSKHTFVKAEVSQMNLSNILDMTNGNIDEFKQRLSQRLSWISLKRSEWAEEKKSQIKEKQILELREIFKNENTNVEDFLGQN